MRSSSRPLWPPCLAWARSGGVRVGSARVGLRRVSGSAARLGASPFVARSHAVLLELVAKLGERAARAAPELALRDPKPAGDLLAVEVLDEAQEDDLALLLVE